MSELKPCPFCGGTAKLHRGKSQKTGAFSEPEITCDGCGIGFSSGIFGPGITPEQAMQMICEDWNRRAPEAGQSVGVQACRDGDREMLQSEAGQKMMEAVTAAMMDGLSVTRIELKDFKTEPAEGQEPVAWLYDNPIAQAIYNSNGFVLGSKRPDMRESWKPLYAQPQLPAVPADLETLLFTLRDKAGEELADNEDSYIGKLLMGAVNAIETLTAAPAPDRPLKEFVEDENGYFLTGDAAIRYLRSKLEKSA